MDAKIEKLNIIKAVSHGDPWEWAYAACYTLLCRDNIIFTINTDKVGRAETIGAIPIEFNNGKIAWCFDKRVVAMVAENTRNGYHPPKGTEIHIPTEEEADEIFMKYGIPQDDDESDNLFCECITIDEDGNPVKKETI